MTKKSTAFWFLVFIAACWGATFPIIHAATQNLNAAEFNAIRFGLATFMALPWVKKDIRSLSKKLVFTGLLVGCIGWFGYFLQAAGLSTVPSARGAFITGFSVVLVPFIAPIFKLHRPKKLEFLLMTLALVGLLILTNPSRGHFTIGDILEFFGAVAFSFHIVLIGSYGNKFANPVHFATLQMIVIALLSLTTTLLCPMVNLARFTPFREINWPLVSLAALIGVSTFILQMKFQPYVAAGKAAIVYASEPVFASLFGYLFLNELISIHVLLGGILVLVAMFGEEGLTFINERVAAWATVKF